MEDDISTEMSILPSILSFCPHTFSAVLSQGKQSYIAYIVSMCPSNQYPVLCPTTPRKCPRSMYFLVKNGIVGLNSNLKTKSKPDSFLSTEKASSSLLFQLLEGCGSFLSAFIPQQRSSTGAPLRISIDGFLNLHFLEVIKIWGFFQKILLFSKLMGFQEPVEPVIKESLQYKRYRQTQTRQSQANLRRGKHFLLFKLLTQKIWCILKNFLTATEL